MNKNNDKYSIKELIKTFDQHFFHAEKERQKALREFPSADWPKVGWDISAALASICREIDEINEWIKRHDLD